MEMCHKQGDLVVWRVSPCCYFFLTLQFDVRLERGKGIKPVRMGSNRSSQPIHQGIAQKRYPIPNISKPFGWLPHSQTRYHKSYQARTSYGYPVRSPRYHQAQPGAPGAPSAPRPDIAPTGPWRYCYRSSSRNFSV